MPQIVTCGNALTDVLVKISSDEVLDKLHLAKGSMTLISEERYAKLYNEIKNNVSDMATGGSAANTALCLTHIGTPSGYIGKINPEDRIGRYFCERFQNEGVAMPPVHAQNGRPSGACVAFVSPDGERTFATFLGAACDLCGEELSLEMFAGARIVHVEGYLVQNHTLIQRVVALAHEAGALVSLDMASYNTVEAEHAFFAELLPQIDIVFANEEEAAAWLPGTPEESLASLADICGLAIVKVGARGAWAQRRGEAPVFGPAERIAQVLDTTAAGDFFAAGFLHRYHQGYSLQDCLHAGSLCAAQVIQVMGTGLTAEAWDKLKTLV